MCYHYVLGWAKYPEKIFEVSIDLSTSMDFCLESSKITKYIKILLVNPEKVFSSRPGQGVGLFGQEHLDPSSEGQVGLTG